MSVAAKAVRQALSVAAGTYAKTILNFGANIVLMRLIAPDQFGILAMGMFFLTLVRKLFGFGFNHAFIHQRENLDRIAPAHLTLLAGTGICSIALMLLGRPLIEAHYGPDIATACLLLALFGIVENVGDTPRLLLEKEIEFTALVKLDVFNVVVSNAFGIVLGMSGLGWWALFGKQALAWFIQSAGAWRLAPPMPGWRTNYKSIRWFFTFGWSMWLAGLATFTVLQFDDFLVGSLDSAEALGYYARAYALAVFPTAMVTHIVGRVAFPLYAQLQNDPERLSRAFMRVLRLILTLTAPGGVLLALIAPELVPLVFGNEWEPMVLILRLLVVYTCLRPIYDDCGELFTALGRPEISSRILVYQAIIVVVTGPPMVWMFGAEGAAISVDAAMALGVFLAYQKVPGYVSFSSARAFGPVIVACLGGLVAVAAALAIWPVTGIYAALALKGSVFALVFTLLLLAMEREALFADARMFLRGAGLLKERA
ncbi:MAG: oligosaccharide flippase family protein [Deltaproteobacteria bacterium]|nr:oligosaccharide flippase family protein [Deltaproteobacteria bacterium]MCB9478856.1 oligosaccharide flippase family protein [Deltaproteobacteria bacterium]